MASFRFRAQPALDLRRREHDAAQRELARADAARDRARDRLHASERAVADARREADAAVQAQPGAVDRDWYRFWIVRLDQERAACRAELDRREAAVIAARTACLDARRRRDALERLRDKAYTAHLAAEAARERKLIDDLATQRYAARRERPEGA